MSSPLDSGDIGEESAEAAEAFGEDLVEYFLPALGALLALMVAVKCLYHVFCHQAGAHLGDNARFGITAVGRRWLSQLDTQSESQT